MLRMVLNLMELWSPCTLWQALGTCLGIVEHAISAHPTSACILEACGHVVETAKTRAPKTLNGFLTERDASTATLTALKRGLGQPCSQLITHY